MRFSKLNYCQYLFISQINYTLTNLAGHLGSISHDPINRYLRREKLTPRLLWENAKPLIQIQENAYVIFDDTVLDKRYAEDIELTRRQYSGNEHGVLRGIGLVNCVYVNPETGQFWVIVSTDLHGIYCNQQFNSRFYGCCTLLCVVCAEKLRRFHRELKQLTGVEACQCRTARIQRNHIGCAMLVWLRLKDLAYQTGQSVYQLKHGLLSNYLIAQQRAFPASHVLGLQLEAR